MTILAVIGLCCVGWAIVAGLRAVSYCQSHGYSISVPLLGVEMLRGLSRYRQLTRAESGRVGPLFYHYVISINAALVIAVGFLVVRIL